MPSTTIPAERMVTFTENKKNKRPEGLLVVGVIVVLLVAGILLGLLFYDILVHENEEVPPKPNKISPWYSEEMCSATCSRTGYSKVPLLIISFDGFRRDYLDQPGWTPSLERMAACGIRADKVLPVYPSKTFPNHFTQVTGLFPVHHGIVDNFLWDKEINPKGPERMTTLNKAYFKGVPIWEYYQRAGGRANCHYWIGSEQHPCTVTEPFNQSKPFEERFQKVSEWINLPEEVRPGFINVYFHEPDLQGHYNSENDFLNSKKLEEIIKKMDQLLGDFLQSLADDGLLNCVNIALLSDHGMTPVKEVIQIEGIFKEEKVFIGGPIARIYSNYTENFLRDQSASCQENNKKYLISTEETRPLRFHHSGSPILGELVLEGRPGVVFADSSWTLPATHGWDYLEKEMQTVFFARGPAFKQGIVLPPFQNVEYFNLFLDLLEMKPIGNNGTVGFFDEALRNPPNRKEKEYKYVRTCSTFSNVSVCCRHPPTCAKGEKMKFFSSKMDFCSFSRPEDCGKTFYSFNNKIRAIVEIITKNTSRNHCSPSVGSCNDFEDSDGILNLLALEIQGKFMKNVLKSLENYQEELLQRLDKLYVLSGITVDRNKDAVLDFDQNFPSTHFYHLFIYCQGESYSKEGKLCTSWKKLKTFGFIFPIIEEEPNCLEEKELLLYYSARLKDVETISGLELVLRGYSTHQQAVIRTRIVEEL